MWKGKITLTKSLFFVNRYVTLVFAFFNTFPLFYAPATNDVSTIHLANHSSYDTDDVGS